MEFYRLVNNNNVYHTEKITQTAGNNTTAKNNNNTCPIRLKLELAPDISKIEFLCYEGEFPIYTKKWKTLSSCLFKPMSQNNKFSILLDTGNYDTTIITKDIFDFLMPNPEYNNDNDILSPISDSNKNLNNNKHWNFKMHIRFKKSHHIDKIAIDTIVMDYILPNTKGILFGLENNDIKDILINNNLNMPLNLT